MIVTKILNTYKFNKIDSGSILKKKTQKHWEKKTIKRHQTRFE